MESYKSRDRTKALLKDMGMTSETADDYAFVIHSDTARHVLFKGKIGRNGSLILTESAVAPPVKPDAGLFWRLFLRMTSREESTDSDAETRYGLTGDAS